MAAFTDSLNRVMGLIDEVNRDGDEPALERAVFLACWAAGVLTGYRSAPLVFVNALKARAIQRVLADGVVVEVPGDLELATAEYGARPVSPRDPQRSPTSFAPLDDTLAVARERWLRPVLSPDVGSLADSVATALGRRLIRLGGPREGEPAIVWAYEPRPGRRMIDVSLQPLRFITGFVGEQPAAVLPKPLPDNSRVVPALPDLEQIRRMDLEDARLLIQIYTVAFRWLRESTVYGEESRAGEDALAGLRVLTGFADELLEPDDPVRLDCAVASATGHVRAAIRGTGTIPTEPLVTEVFRVRDRLRASPEDAGPLLDVLSRAAVALNRARNGAGSRVDSAAMVVVIHECWRTFNDVLRSRVQLAPGASAAGYHLHSYAGFLGTLDDVESLRTAVDLFRRYVIPSRRAAYGASPRGNSLRIAVQVAARGAGKLADLPELSDSEAAAAAELGAGWAWEAVATENAAELLDPARPPEEGNVLFASAVLRAIESAAKRGGSVAPPAGIEFDRPWLDVLGDAVRRSHAWIAAEERSEDRIKLDAALDARLEAVRASAQG
jgi:hypothetical protein